MMSIFHFSSPASCRFPSACSHFSLRVLASVCGDVLGLDDGHERAAVHGREERVQLPPEAPREGEDVGFGFCVVEGDLALLVVQVHPHAAGDQAEGQLRLGLGAGVEVVGASPQGPVAPLRGHVQVALPLRVGGRQADPPAAVVGEVHLPVVAPPAVALPAQHAGPAVEALAVVGQVGLGQTLLDFTVVV